MAKIKLRLASGYTSTDSGCVTRDSHFHAVTGQSVDGKAFIINLAIERLQPLMTGDLNADEM